MDSKNEIYDNQAKEILRIITLYKALKLEQILNITSISMASSTTKCSDPSKIKENTRYILNMLIKNKRVFFNEQNGIVSSTNTFDMDKQIPIIKAFWVLLDFIEKSEYHSISDFPVNIIFFKTGELYEIIYIPFGQEILISQATKTNDGGIFKKILIIDVKEQISKINISNVVSYCLITKDKPTYFKQN